MGRAVRMSKEARREQLLDAASTLLVTKGLSGLTMEGLAAQAGVSKALPYSHFENAEAAAVALYQREMEVLGTSVLRAMNGDRSDRSAALRAAIHAFFDYVEANGELLSVVAGSGSPVPEWANAGEPLGENFVADLLSSRLGVEPGRAREVSGMFLGALNGAVASVAQGAMSLRRAKEVTVQFVEAGLAATD